MSRRLESGDHEFLRDIDFSRHAAGEALRLGEGAPYLLALAFRSLGLEAQAAELFRLQVARGGAPWEELALVPLLEILTRGGDYMTAARLARRYALSRSPEADLVRKALVEALYWAREDQAALDALAAGFPSGKSASYPELDAELALFRAVASSRVAAQGWPDMYLRLCLEHSSSAVHVRLSQFLAREETIRSALDAPVRALLEAKASIAAGQQGRALAPLEAALPALGERVSEGVLRETGQAYLAAGEPGRGARFLAHLGRTLGGPARLAAQEASGRLYRAAGDGSEAWSLLSAVAASTPSPAQRDRALWVLADMAAKTSARAGVTQIARSAAAWSDPSYFDDLVDDLVTRLLAGNDRESLRQLFEAVAGLQIPARIRLYYILVRLGDRALPDARQILASSPTTVSEDYYRLLLNAEAKAEEKPAAASGPGAEAAGDADFLLDRLLDFGLHERATALIRRGPRRASRAARLAAARRLIERGRYREAIALAGNGFPWDESRREAALVAYPRAFEREIRELAGREKLEPRLLFAVAREESAFDPAIVSSAGAVGLTQLLPSTAAEEAARLRLPSYDLRSARDNLSIGSHYLGRLIRLQESLPFGLAAYNAGLTRVRQWKQQFAHLPADLLIEAIPFEETRHYIRKVLVSAAVYGVLYEQLPASRTLEMFYGPRSSLDK